jgi:membrane protease YdiL (CAAX protease family)
MSAERTDLLLDDERRLRTVWRLVLYAVAAVLLQAPARVAAGMLLPAERTDTTRFVLLLLICMVLLTPLLLALTWAFRRLLDRRDFRSVGLARPRPQSKSSPLWGAAVGGGLAVLPVAALVAGGSLKIVGLGSPVRPLLLAPVLLLAAFQEELAFRGYALRNMLDVRRPVLGLAVTSVAFTAFHALNAGFGDSPINALTVLLCGVLLGLAYMVSENLWFPTALHFAWNFMHAGVFGMPVSGLDLGGLLELQAAGPEAECLAGGAFGLEGSPLAAVVVGAACVVFAVLLARPGRGWSVRSP